MESGFSVNKDMLVENLGTETLVNRRIVYDAVKEGGGVLKMAGKVEKPLLVEVRRASSRYKEAAREKRKEQEDDQDGKRRALKRKLQEEIRDIMKKKAQVENQQAESLYELKKQLREKEYLLSKM